MGRQACSLPSLDLELNRYNSTLCTHYQLPGPSPVHTHFLGKTAMVKSNTGPS